jgi:cytochrome oxidase Cu insertion factor (SCO1/SenC/PrrC family)
MNNSALPYWLTFAVLVAALYGGYKMYQVEKSHSTGGVVEAPRLPPLKDFELTDQEGRPFRSADMKGKVWVASFFFSTCPKSCGRLNANIRYLTQQEELQDVTWVSITVDPQTDTQQVLAEYAKTLRADTTRWRFCRHDDFDYVKRLSEDVLRVGGVNYKGHNDYVVVIDRNGQIAGMFDGYNSDSLEKGVTLLQRILAEPAEAPAADAPAADPPASEAA